MNKIIIEKEFLDHNLRIIKKYLADNSMDNKVPNIIAVVKGNGYGLGLVEFSSYLHDNRIETFAVTDTQDAIKLKNIGIKDILILNGTELNDELQCIVDNDFIASCGSIEAINKLNQLGLSSNKIIRIHLKIDTGFSRYGFIASKILNDESVFNDLIKTIKESNNLKIAGIYTHFQESYADDSKRTNEQFKLFMDVVSKIEQAGVSVGIRHVANSYAFLKYPNMFLDAVRIGGIFSGRVVNNIGLKKAGYLESEISTIKGLPKGRLIGYSGTYITKKDTKVAVIPAGYYEGVDVHGPRDKVRLIDKLRTLRDAIVKFFKDDRHFVTVNGSKVPVLRANWHENFCDRRI